MSTYMQDYKSKLITAEKAAQLVNSNDIVEYGMFSTKPVDFDIALGKRVGELENVSIRGGPTVFPIPEVITNDPEQKSFKYFSWIFSVLDRQAAASGLSCYSPLNYHEGTMMGYNRLDGTYNFPLNPMANIVVIQTTAMDKYGCFNFGLANCMTRAWGLTADIVIVEVNENMPRCLGGNDEYFHISEVDYIIEGSNSALFAYPPYSPPVPEENPVEYKIARFISSEITDGACIQLGIGAVPNMIGEMIVHSDLKDLGIQTEMFCDSMVRMYETGKITNINKARDRNKCTYSFSLGTQETYDWLNDNPRCASCTVEYINNPQLIAINDNVVSINNILEVDLFSQICSESAGIRQVAGTGGQLDFVIGAFHSRGGKSFLAFSSTYKDKEGKIESRIKPVLPPGAIVTVPRTCVQYLVTEYGMVNMKGLSIWGRAEAVISIAHPNFRDELIKAAKEMNIWSKTNRIPF